MSDENKTNIDSPTIIGKDAKDIINSVNTAPDDFESTRKIDTLVTNTAKDVQAMQKISISEVYDEDEDDFTPPPQIAQAAPETSLAEEEIEEIEEIIPEPKAEAPKKKKKNYFKKLLNKLTSRCVVIPLSVALGIALLIFSVLYGLSLASLPYDKVAKNVYIEDLPVGGMTYDEMLLGIRNTYLFEDQQVTLKCNGQSFSISGADIGLVASPEETAQKAFNYAKTGNNALNGLKNMLLIFKRHTIVPVAEVDTNLLSAKLQEFGVQVHGELVQHTLVVQANHEVLITPGHTGFNNDPSKALEEVLAAFDKERFKNIYVTLDSCPPDDLTIEKVDADIYMNPVNAYYTYDGDAVNIIADVEGRYIDKASVEPLLPAVKEGTEPISIPWYSTPAEITTQMLEDQLFDDVLASYSTDYGASTYNRALNVSRAAELLNGAVIPPGETFSFNDRVGNRSKENGFYSAPEYVDGKTVQGIGGGTCQVSTTLYSAVLYADLDIVTRTNHMFTISYAPLGQDATVAYGSVDFKFLNNTDYPIKISSYTENGEIYVVILGTAWPDSREVKIKHNVSYGTGTTVTSRRYVYVGDECIAQESIPSSYYKPHQ